MSKSNNAKMMTKNVATKNSAKSAAPQAPVAIEAPPAQVAPPAPEVKQAQAGADALRGRIESRTHAIHVVLIDAYKRGALLKMSEIVSGARALLTSAHKSYEKLDRTAPSHINTMKGRLFVERVTKDNVTGWRLTELGATLTGANVAQVEVKKERKSRKKAK